MIANTPIDFGWLHDDAAIGGADPVRTALVIALVAAGTALLAAIVVRHLRRDRASDGPAVRHLARGLGLSGGERRLVMRMARVAGRPHAGSLLISRGCFDAAVRVYTRRYRPPAGLAAIRARVFE